MATATKTRKSNESKMATTNKNKTKVGPKATKSSADAKSRSSVRNGAKGVRSSATSKREQPTNKPVSRPNNASITKPRSKSSVRTGSASPARSGRKDGKLETLGYRVEKAVPLNVVAPPVPYDPFADVPVAKTVDFQKDNHPVQITVLTLVYIYGFVTVGMALAAREWLLALIGMIGLFTIWVVVSRGKDE